MEELKRYSRQIILSEIGTHGQQKLKQAKVLVIGAGGLGCPVLQYLVAAGVGTIGIADDDKVDVSNLHRQILYTINDTGRNKAETAAEKLKMLNPHVNFVAFPLRITEQNASSLIQAFDLVIDGSDNFETRYLVNDTCVNLDKPFVFGSIFGFEGQLSVFNYQQGPTYRCVFPEPSDTPNCEVNGVIGVLPGIVGTYMANEALKLILEIGETLSGKLLVINILENTFHSFKLKRSAPLKNTLAEPISITKQQSKEEHLNYLNKSELENLQNNEGGNVLVIDVREPFEHEADSFGDLNIPLSEIPDEADKLPFDKKIVLYCNSGKRSKQAFELLRATGFAGELYWS